MMLRYLRKKKSKCINWINEVNFDILLGSNLMCDDRIFMLLIDKRKFGKNLFEANLIF